VAYAGATENKSPGPPKFWGPKRAIFGHFWPFLTLLARNGQKGPLNGVNRPNKHLILAKNGQNGRFRKIHDGWIVSLAGFRYFHTQNRHFGYEFPDEYINCSRLGTWILTVAVSQATIHVVLTTSCLVGFRDLAIFDILGPGGSIWPFWDLKKEWNTSRFEIPATRPAGIPQLANLRKGTNTVQDRHLGPGHLGYPSRRGCEKEQITSRIDIWGSWPAGVPQLRHPRFHTQGHEIPGSQLGRGSKIPLFGQIWLFMGTPFWPLFGTLFWPLFGRNWRISGGYLANRGSKKGSKKEVIFWTLFWPFLPFLCRKFRKRGHFGTPFWPFLSLWQKGYLGGRYYP
jgi:hypothetical protein